MMPLNTDHDNSQYAFTKHSIYLKNLNDELFVYGLKIIINEFILANCNSVDRK